MRNNPLRVLTFLLPLAAASLHAQPRSVDVDVDVDELTPVPAPVRLTLSPEQTLRPGAHAAIEVLVDLPPGNDSPLLLTPSLEGDAVEVVRGRLTRPDGKPVEGTPTRLRFEVPVLARSEGTAILHVDLMTYLCERTCRRITLRGSQVVRVRP